MPVEWTFYHKVVVNGKCPRREDILPYFLGSGMSTVAIMFSVLTFTTEQRLC